MHYSLLYHSRFNYLITLLFSHRIAAMVCLRSTQARRRDVNKQNPVCPKDTDDGKIQQDIDNVTNSSTYVY